MGAGLSTAELGAGVGPDRFAKSDNIIFLRSEDRLRSPTAELEKGANFEGFFGHAPRLNAARSLISGMICGIRVATIEEPMMRAFRYLDKRVVELARGQKMERFCGAKGWAKPDA